MSSGGDNDLFSIDVSTGEVKFNASLDFDAPGNVDGENVYEVTVEVCDGSLSGTQAVSITLTDQNDNAPVITTETELSVAEDTLVVAALTSTAINVTAFNLISLSGNEASRPA